MAEVLAVVPEIDVADSLGRQRGSSWGGHAARHLCERHRARATDRQHRHPRALSA